MSQPETPMSGGRSMKAGLIGNVIFPGLFGAMFLGWVFSHGSLKHGKVIVHVLATDADVTVGPVTFHIGEAPMNPITCEIPVGRHDLIVRRDGERPYKRSFEVRSGEEAVLMAWPVPPPD